ncbi:hypothetical protein E4U42_008099 [Claviceps africana]|uniref:Uncharacterized protein n=1 Tax=Claviceps africana TaxID=83212 RepID=A0A8K0J144_9HYPO|nr:hypothetical protein E4U42_008099 [Claviceps africana]
MADEDKNPRPEAVTDDHLAQTYRDLAKGEQTADQIEASLSVLESKLEAMLDALEGRTRGGDDSGSGAQETK